MSGGCEEKAITMVYATQCFYHYCISFKKAWSAQLERFEIIIDIDPLVRDLARPEEGTTSWLAHDNNIVIIVITVRP